MPSQRPSAAFDPIPPDIDLAALVEETPNFEYVTRVPYEMIEQQGMEQFERLVLLHVILGGKPLVIEGFHQRLDEWTFTSQWLRDNCGPKYENAWNIGKQQYLPLSIGHYLNNLSKLTNQWTTNNYRDTDRQRIYLKDIDCPELWHEKLKEHVPASIFYLNEGTGEFGGPGAADLVPTKNSTHLKDRGVARAGDLMSSLAPNMRADNLMCYIGHEGTYTPAHREMCASLGQNLMVDTSGTVDEEGKPAKPGSSIWFMTETNDRHLVSEYWLSTLGHDIEVEKHFAQINAWKAAPFNTYVVEQKKGDFILIPPLAPHQVWNRGSRTMKVAWNRITVETLEFALREALPRARMVCRDEQYKSKAIIYLTLQKYSGLLQRVEALKESELDEQVVLDLTYNSRIRQLQKDFRRLFALYTEIVLSETLAPVAPSEKKGQYLPYDSFVTCSYCRCNIFNRFLTCESCIEPLQNGEENTYDICMDCYAMGRSCKCISNLKWVEQFPWQELTERHDQWRRQIISLDGGINERSPRSLQSERKKLGKKTLGQVCQEQLKTRPWNDPKNPKSTMTTAEMNNMRSGKDPNGEDDDTPSKVSKKKGPAKLEPGFVAEHVGCHPREAWRCATCAKCGRSFQYGSLWRMFDLMPQMVMEQYEWECPVCQKFCSCAACKRKADNIPYEPRGTVLGHDTRKFADPRSIESLVDFSMSNLHHIKKTGDDDPRDSRRIGRRLDEAAEARSRDPQLAENYVEEDELAPVEDQFYENGIRYTTEPDIPIDPILSLQQPGVPTVDAQKANASLKPHRRLGDDELDGDWGRQQRPRKKPPNKQPTGKERGGQASASRSKPRPSSSTHATAGIAPVANMSESAGGQQESHGKGLQDQYQYPEPTGTEYSPSGAFSRSHGPIARANGDLAHTGHLGHAENVTQFQQAQLDRSLQEAKRKGRYIIAEAALTGKSLPVVLKAGRLGMALMADRVAAHSNDNTRTRVVETELLRSDVPPIQPSSRPANAPKKRKVLEGEPDGEFSTRKRRDRKSETTQPQNNRETQSQAEETDFTEESDAAENVFVSVNKPRGPRKLPKYLADQHEDGDLPAELPQDVPRRRSSQVKNLRSTSGINDSPQIKTARLAAEKAEADKVAQENWRAKQKAVQWADGDQTDSETDDEPDSQPQSKSGFGKAKDALMKVPQSMFSRMAGRKIKVAGAKSKG